MLDGIREALVSLEARMDRRFEGLDQKLSRHFMWLVGIQVTTLAAIVAALAAK
jgi:hypothetical protein